MKVIALGHLQPTFLNSTTALCAPKVRNAAAELAAAHRSGRARNVKR
jgi:hypothetical protein